MRAKLDQVHVGGQEGSLAEAMSGASVAPSRPGSEGNRRKAGGWSLGASGWLGCFWPSRSQKGLKRNQAVIGMTKRTTKCSEMDMTRAWLGCLPV